MDGGLEPCSLVPCATLSGAFSEAAHFGGDETIPKNCVCILHPADQCTERGNEHE